MRKLISHCHSLELVNTAEMDGGGISANTSMSLTFTGTSSFHSNSAMTGGAISTNTNMSFSFTGTSSFHSNSAMTGGAISTNTNMSFSFTGTSSFHSNSALVGGGISGNRNTTLIFDGNVSFTNNGHNIDKLNINNANNGESYGGAIYLAIRSTFPYCFTQLCIGRTTMQM